MGQYADDIIDGYCDSSGDYTYKDNYKPKRRRKFVPDTPVEASIRAVRKELAILIASKITKETTEKEENVIVHASRKAINNKYGAGWRESQTILKPLKDE